MNAKKIVALIAEAIEPQLQGSKMGSSPRDLHLKAAGLMMKRP